MDLHFYQVNEDLDGVSEADSDLSSRAWAKPVSYSLALSSGRLSQDADFKASSRPQKTLKGKCKNSTENSFPPK